MKSIFGDEVHGMKSRTVISTVLALAAVYLAAPASASGAEPPAAGTNVVLEGGLKVELAAGKFCLPAAITAPDGFNLLSSNDMFRMVYAYADDRDEVAWVDEDNRNEKAFTLVSQEILPGTQVVFRAQLLTDRFAVTRTLSVAPDRPAVTVEYALRCLKNTVLKTADALYLPVIPLADDFDRAVYAAYPDGKLELYDIAKQKISLDVRYPFTTPCFAIASTRGCGVALLPELVEGVLPFELFSNVLIAREHAIRVRFSLLFLPREPMEAIMKIMAERMKDSDRRGLAANIASGAWELYEAGKTDAKKVDLGLKRALEAIELYPSYPRAYNVAAYCCQRKGDPAGAARYWMKAGEAGYGNAKFDQWAACSILGAVRQGTMPGEMMATALRLHQRSIEFGPNQFWNYARSAETHAYLGRTEEAIRLYEKALALMASKPEKPKIAAQFEKSLAELKAKLATNSPQGKQNP